MLQYFIAEQTFLILNIFQPNYLTTIDNSHIPLTITFTKLYLSI